MPKSSLKINPKDVWETRVEKEKTKYFDDYGVELHTGQVIDSGAGTGVVCMYEGELSVLWFGCNYPYSLEHLESWKRKDPFEVVTDIKVRKNWLELFKSKTEWKYDKYLSRISINLEKQNSG